MKISLFLYSLLFLLFVAAPAPQLSAAIHAGIGIQKQGKQSKKNKIKSSTKKQKTKKMQGLSPLTKGILSAALGAVSILAVLGSIAASFAFSTGGVAAGILIGLGAGFAAIFLGIKARKELKASGEKGGFLGILGIVFGSIAGATLLILSLGALFG